MSNRPGFTLPGFLVVLLVILVVASLVMSGLALSKAQKVDAAGERLTAYLADESIVVAPEPIRFRRWVLHTNDDLHKAIQWIQAVRANGLPGPAVFLDTHSPPPPPPDWD